MLKQLYIRISTRCVYQISTFLEMLPCDSQLGWSLNQLVEAIQHMALSTHVCIDMNNFNWLDGWQLETLDNGLAIEW